MKILIKTMVHFRKLFTNNLSCYQTLTVKNKTLWLTKKSYENILKLLPIKIYLYIILNIK